MTLPATGAAATGARTLRLLLFAALLLFGALMVGYFGTAHWAAQPLPRDGTTLVVGRDFLNFWMVGRAAVADDPGRFYDAAVYAQALAALLGPGYPGQSWSYPPNLLLLAAPFGFLPYLAALAAFLAGGFALLLLALRRLGWSWRVVAAAAFSPAAALCFLSGQSSCLTAAALLTAFRLLAARPAQAGILLGLLTMKPQVGLLFPIMLIATRRWRVLAWAAATGLLLAAVTALLYGPGIWLAYLNQGLPTQNLVLADPRALGAPYMATVFMNLRCLGVPYAGAMAGQAVFIVGAVVLTWKMFRAPPPHDPGLLMAGFFACAAFATPYMLSYDLLALSCAVTPLLASGRLLGWARLAGLLVYFTPLVQLFLGLHRIPGPGLIAPAFALAVLTLLRQGKNRAAA